jgi:hypothetical protein
MMNKRYILRQVSWTFFIFGLLGWIYIVINSEVHPWTLSWQLTHFFKKPREDTFGEICFAVSFISFLINNLLKPGPKT